LNNTKPSNLTGKVCKRDEYWGQFERLYEEDGEEERSGKIL